MMLDTVLKVYVPAQVLLARQAKLFAKRTEGASGIEYAIIAAMVAVVIAGLSPGVGTAIKNLFAEIVSALPKTKE
ncbi:MULTISPECIES: Flp family type IVb pilin [unclassified Pseudomonas]|uniref:Flp family type IVb pilin n=1 Tax=unclassified Pseudomonas TaxID=196821 RepID=UPI001C5B209A|nr:MULTISPECIES: Flp family type IVb pilin [unclassified Pseudomonas]MBW3506618.1 Flp family type IVb pilin [Pseudomonas sp. NKUCC02_KPG]MEC4166158.1 Flp family type IVb pilin [Pseudomonas sp. MS-1(2024)]